MLLSNHMRISQLIQRRSECQSKLRRMNVEITDLKRYAEHIADGKVSLFEMFRTPTSMFNRQMMFMQTSSIFCQQSATNQMNYMMAQPNYQQMIMQQSQQNPQAQQAYMAMMYENFYNEAQKQFAQYEAELLHDKESEMEQERTSVQTELEMIDAELKQLREQRKQDVQELYSA